MSEQRKPKQSREDLRATLLEAGREILLEEGLGTGSSNLTFKRVFERVEKKTGVRVTNASVIRRVWDNQSDFQADVLVAIAQDEGRPETDRTVGAVVSVFDGVDLSTVESRARAMQEVCRVGGEASTKALADSPNWSLWISVVAMATTTTLPDQQLRMQTALLEGYGTVAKFWEEIYQGLIDLLGLRIRQPWTIRQFTMAVTAFAEGCSLRQHVTGNTERITRPTGPNGEDREWTLFSAGLEALASQFFEPDPDFVPPPA